MESQNRPNEVILGDVLRLALPLKTQVVGGASATRRQIRWAVLLTSWDDLPDQAQADDLVLVAEHLQHAIDEEELCARLRRLARLDVAGLLFFAKVSKRVEEVAAEVSTPLVIVPSSFSVREINQGIAALLVDQQSATSERAMQLYRRLSTMSREGQGLQAMTDVMSNLTGNIVFVQDKRMEIQAESWPSDAKVSKEELRKAITKRDELPAVLRNRKAAARARQSYWQQILPVEDLGRLISPIVSGDRARGYLSIVGPAASLDLLDSLTAEHGAAACALEMAKAKAVSEARKLLRGDFLEGLLAGTLPPREIDRLSSRLDHDTKAPHMIITLGWLGTSPPSTRRLETTINWLLSNHRRPALVHDYGGQYICIFHTMKSEDETEPVYEFINRVLEQVKAESPGESLAGGLSGPAAKLADWPRVYEEALQAMQLGKRLSLADQIVEFNSLGVYQLLWELESIPAVAQFTESVIGPLATYDRDHNGSLVKTLEAFFNQHGNYSRTAESLFVHRNTLLYRMDRIQDLTEQDVNNADMRLALQLALKFWRLSNRNT